MLGLWSSEPVLAAAFLKGCGWLTEQRAASSNFKADGMEDLA